MGGWKKENSYVVVLKSFPFVGFKVKVVKGRVEKMPLLCLSLEHKAGGKMWLA